MLRRHPRDIVGRYAFDTWHELSEVVVRQVVERDLRRRARDLLGGFEIPARSRASARPRRAPAPLTSPAADRGSPAISSNDSWMASAVAAVCTLTCSANGPGHAAKIERRAGAVGEALLLAQIEIDAADELAAEHHVGGDEGVVVGRVSRDRHVADAQLRLRRAGPRDHVESRRQRQRRRRRQFAASATPVQSSNAAAAIASISCVIDNRRPPPASHRTGASSPDETRARRRSSAT